MRAKLHGLEVMLKANNKTMDSNWLESYSKGEK